MSLKACSCGSGLAREAVNDARGIFVAFVCDECREERLNGYRPEIFDTSTVQAVDNPNYEASEPIEPENH